MRLLCLILSCLLGAAASCQQKFEFIIAESVVGECVYQSDATNFKSTTKIAVAGTEIRSELSGTWRQGQLATFKIVQTVAKQSIVVDAADGKATITANGKTTNKDYVVDGALFSNYHPWLSSTFAKPSVPTGQEEAVKVFVMEGLTTVELKALSLPTRIVQRGDQREPIQVLRLKFPNVTIDVFRLSNQEVVGWDVPSQRFVAIRPGYGDLTADPTSKYVELSQPSGGAEKESNVSIMMRDGVRLKADVYRPSAAGRYPTILARTPYGKSAAGIEGEWWAKRGYIYIAQDVRGRGNSEGEWRPFFAERKDGFDTVDWISKQPWSDGGVGMIGASYGGWVQWWTAVERHPALKCIIPQVSPPDPYYNLPFDHGVPYLFGGVWWARVVMDKEMPTNLYESMGKASNFLNLPITKVDDGVLGRSIPFVDDWWVREPATKFYGVNFERDLAGVNIPALHISGWWDGDGIGTKRNYAAMRRLGKPNQVLIYGPWSHAFNTTTTMGDVDYGPGAILDLQSLYLRWFDQWLKGKPVWTGQSPVRAFMTGANEWIDMDSWPSRYAKEQVLYLRGDMPANTPLGKGRLSFEPPKSEEPDRYTYNPAGAKMSQDTLELDPSKTSSTLKIDDTTQDGVLYRTDALKTELEIAGPISLDLHFSTSAVDTDFFVFLADEDAKGVLRLIGMPGKIRAKYMGGVDEIRLLTPNKVYKATIELWDTMHQFKPGHKVVVLISSQWFPTYARNLNTGEPVATGTRMVAAHQTIYHDAKRPSALRFYSVPRGKG